MHDYLCCVSLGLLYIFVVKSLVFYFCFLSSVVAKRLTVKSISEMTYFVSNGM